MSVGLQLRRKHRYNGVDREYYGKTCKSLALNKPWHSGNAAYVALSRVAAEMPKELCWRVRKGTRREGAWIPLCLDQAVPLDLDLTEIDVLHLASLFVLHIFLTRLVF